MRKKRGVSGESVCHIMSDIHIGVHAEQRTYLCSPIGPADPLPDFRSDLKDRVRLGAAGGILQESWAHKAGRGLPVQPLRAREGQTFKAALLHEPCV